MAKLTAFGEDARRGLEWGMNLLADTVKRPTDPRAQTWFSTSSEASRDDHCRRCR